MKKQLVVLSNDCSSPIRRYDLGEVGRYRINKKLELDIDSNIRVLTKRDIISIIQYLIELVNSRTDVDDIDHLSNRRVRTVGEQLYNQFGVGLARMARTIRERMNIRDNEVFTPTDLVNARTLSSVINSFLWNQPTISVYGSNQPIGRDNPQKKNVCSWTRRFVERKSRI